MPVAVVVLSLAGWLSVFVVYCLRLRTDGLGVFLEIPIERTVTQLFLVFLELQDKVLDETRGLDYDVPERAENNAGLSGAGNSIGWQEYVAACRGA